MKVNKYLSILFWLWRQKASKDGLAPIYVRITVKGDRDGFHPAKKSILISGTKKPQARTECAPTANSLTAI